MHKKTIKQLANALQNKEFSSEELVSSYLDRCEAHNTDLNCFISLMPETAVAQARSADKIIKNGNAGPLTGIPLAHKDIFLPTVQRQAVAQRSWIILLLPMMQLLFQN